MTDTHEGTAENLTVRYQTLHAKVHAQYNRRDDARRVLDDAIVQGSEQAISTALRGYREAVLALWALKVESHDTLTLMKQNGVRFLWLTDEHDPNEPVTPY